MGVSSDRSGKRISNELQAITSILKRSRLTGFFALIVPSLIAGALVLLFAVRPVTVDMTHMLSPRDAGVLTGTLVAMVAYSAVIALKSVQEPIEIGQSSKQKSPTIARLEFELDRLANTGFVCVVVGIAIAVFGVVFAWFAGGAFTVPKESGEFAYIAVGLYLLPKLSVLIVVELFAWFFLKVYRQTFEQIRFYNNELTTLELKLKAIDVAQSLGAQGAATVEKLLVVIASEDRQKHAPIVERDGSEINAAIKILEAFKNAKS